MAEPQRQQRVVDLAAAGARVQDGMTVALGGFNTANRPAALVRELVRQGRRNLTVVAPPCSLDVDLLVGAGCVRRLITPSVSAEGLAPVAPLFRHAVQTGAVELREVDAGMVLAALKAGRQGLPFLPWRGGVGTSVPELNPDLGRVECPFTGERLVAVPAVRPDVALIHAYQADAFGNVQHAGNPFADVLVAQASAETLVQVERLVDNAAIRRRPERTSLSPVFVRAVVVAPYGSHPFFGHPNLLLDTAHVGEYLAAARARLAGDPRPWEAYLERYVYGVTSHAEYLRRVGRRRLQGLRIKGVRA